MVMPRRGGFEVRSPLKSTRLMFILNIPVPVKSDSRNIGMDLECDGDGYPAKFLAHAMGGWILAATQ